MISAPSSRRRARAAADMPPATPPTTTILMTTPQDSLAGDVGPPGNLARLSDTPGGIRGGAPLFSDGEPFPACPLARNRIRDLGRIWGGDTALALVGAGYQASHCGRRDVPYDGHRNPPVGMGR